jgi:rRNA maturation endonuclease Nob1
MQFIKLYKVTIQVLSSLTNYLKTFHTSTTNLQVNIQNPLNLKLVGILTGHDIKENKEHWTVNRNCIKIFFPAQIN